MKVDFVITIKLPGNYNKVLYCTQVQHKIKIHKTNASNLGVVELTMHLADASEDQQYNRKLLAKLSKQLWEHH